jgi:hypothetical protein
VLLQGGAGENMHSAASGAASARLSADLSTSYASGSSPFAAASPAAAASAAAAMAAAAAAAGGRAWHLAASRTVGSSLLVARPWLALLRMLIQASWTLVPLPTRFRRVCCRSCCWRLWHNSRPL